LDVVPVILDRSLASHWRPTAGICERQVWRHPAPGELSAGAHMLLLCGASFALVLRFTRQLGLKLIP
jgi:hypothetical protein